MCTRVGEGELIDEKDKREKSTRGESGAGWGGAGSATHLDLVDELIDGPGHLGGAPHHLVLELLQKAQQLQKESVERGIESEGTCDGWRKGEGDEG